MQRDQVLQAKEEYFHQSQRAYSPFARHSPVHPNGPENRRERDPLSRFAPLYNVTFLSLFRAMGDRSFLDYRLTFPIYFDLGEKRQSTACRQTSILYLPINFC